MGLCASLLKPKAKKRYPEPRRGMPKALFVVREDGRGQSKPKKNVFQAHDSGRSRLHKPIKVGSRRNEERKYQGSGDALALALDRRFCALEMPRLPSGGTRREPVTTMPWRKMATDPPGLCMTRTTPMTPGSAPMTPMRPVWQRRILMGMRCELPRFSGLILYDEHGRPIQSGTPSRRNYQRGKKKITRTSTATTLRDLL